MSRGCFISFYECLFYKLKLRIIFTNFYNGVLEHLHISHSHQHHVARAFVKMFQYKHEYNGQEGYASVNLYFYIFMVYRTSMKGRWTRDSIHKRG